MNTVYAIFLTLVFFSPNGEITTKIVNTESMEVCTTAANMIVADYKPSNPDLKNSVRIDDNGNKLLLLECRKASATKYTRT